MSSKIRLEKKQSSSMIPLLPDDIIVDILARVSIFNYPTLSLVSKHFRSLVTSPHLYERRSLLGCTEACLYVMLYKYNGDHTYEHSWHILQRKANGHNRLILIPSLPRMLNFSSSFVAVGSRIYMFGGVYNHSMTLADLSIECGSHMVQSLPSMPMGMDYTAAGIIDEKIYVIGHFNTEKKNIMLVFNTETQMLESEMTMLDIESGYICSRGVVVIGDKMYMRNSKNSFVYTPKENKLETDKMLNLEKWENACAIDNILYYYDSFKKKLRAYDSTLRRWGVVKGLESLPDAYSSLSNIVNYGEKLVLLFMGHRNIWCAEIALERRQGGEIWGNVEWVEVVLNGNFSLWKSLSVMV